jgi:hypothetical protein
MRDTFQGDHYPDIPEEPQDDAYVLRTERGKEDISRINIQNAFIVTLFPFSTSATALPTQTIKTLREAKIHAEIQIIFHYELNPSKLPRLVCSGKDACYPCNTFLLMHGKMHTPRYHGRIYPGWKLPALQKSSNLDVHFNSVLEDRIE